MKQYIRSRVGKLSSYTEIYLSILIILGICIVSVSLIRDLSHAVVNLIGGNFHDFDYEEFLGLALKLIIGVEFVKMISKHTPESTIDVLLFAIARKIIIDDSKYFEILIGILAITILFIIKKFLYTPNLSDPTGYVLDASTNIKEANYIAKTRIPVNTGENLLEVITEEFKKLDMNIKEGSSVIIEGAKLKIYSMQNNNIEKIEIIPLNENFLTKVKKHFRNE